VTREKIRQELEALFEKAMNSGNVSVALKAKEMMLKLCQSSDGDKPYKPLSQWTDQEIEMFVLELEKDNVGSEI
jgi:hypothetical protein